MSEVKLMTTKLKNGLTVAQINLPNFHSITNFLIIRSGSRYENARNNGVAHFLEHMVFKGTKKYPDTASIAKAIEGVGGGFNAWTSVDHTVYYNTVPSAQFEVGMTVPFELAYWPLLRSEDLERERGVIIEEIRMIQDDPARWVQDLSEQLLFAGHSLGRSIIGTEETINNMSIADFKDYHAEHYQPQQSVFIAVGNLEGVDVVSQCEQLGQDLPKAEISQVDKFTGSSQRGLKIVNKNTDQTHFVLAVASPQLAINTEQTPVARVLNALLGQGMSSRLFLHIREQKGLAYAIHSDYSNVEDTGTISIYGGINTPKILPALEAVWQELEKLKTDLVEAEELHKAQTMIVGHYDISSDKPLDLARWYGSGLLFNDHESLAEAKAKVMAVTPDQVQTLARELFNKEYMTLALIGPHPEEAKFQQYLK